MFGKHMKHETPVSAGLITWKQAPDLFREHEKNLPAEQTRIPGTASTLVLLMIVRPESCFQNHLPKVATGWVEKTFVLNF